MGVHKVPSDPLLNEDTDDEDEVNSLNYNVRVENDNDYDDEDDEDDDEENGDKSLKNRHNHIPEALIIPKFMLNGEHMPQKPSQLKAGEFTSSTPEKKKLRLTLTHGSHVSSHDEGHTNEAKETGLFSKLLSSFNLKSLTDLNEDPSLIADNLSPTTTNSKDEQLPLVESLTNGSGVSSKANLVSFKPVKKSLLQTLGNGSLTLDEFPDSNTSQQIQRGNSLQLNTSLSSYHSPTEMKNSLNQSNRSNSPIPLSDSTNRKSMNPNDLEIAKNRLNSNSLANENESDRSSHKSQSGSINEQDLQKKSKSLKLKLPRRSTTDQNLSATFEQKKSIYQTKFDIELPSEKRQKSFHSLFNDIPLDDLFLTECTCALRKDILIQGKLYLTEHNICFHSNIIGLVTHLTIPFNKIYNIRKTKTMGIPNAIEFSNLHEKFTFASFISRDIVFDLISKIWRANGNTSDGILTLGVDEEDLESMDPVSEYVVSDDEEEDDDDDENNGAQGDDEDDNGNEKAVVPRKKSLSKKQKQKPEELDNWSDSSSDNDMVKEGEDEAIVNNAGSDDTKYFGMPLRGPKAHPPTSIDYKEETGDVKVIEDTINAPVSIVYDLLFGDDPAFIKYVIGKQGNIKILEIPKFESNTRNYQYTKPLNAPVGPKETRCLVEETSNKMDFNDFCLATQLTASPDVPSGNSFKVRTKIWLSWGANNQTKLFIVTNVIWSGKSWIKGVIEKNTYSGQKEALGIMATELKKKVESLKSAGGSPIKKQKKKVKVEIEKQKQEVESIKDQIIEIENEKSFVDKIISQLDLKMMLIVILFIWMIFKSFSTSHDGINVYSQKRMIKSESNLWEWIESRELDPSNKSVDSDVKKYQKKLKKQDLRNEIEFEEKKLELLKQMLLNS